MKNAMVGVLVEHHLNPAGKTYFPLWIKQVESVLANYEGFLSIKQLRDVKYEGRTLLFLNFENLESLHAWSSSEVHRLELSKLQKFMLRDQESQVFEII